MQLHRQHATSYRPAAITAVVGALAAASLLLVPALAVVHQITDHSGEPEDCTPPAECYLCLHFDQDGIGEAAIVTALYPHWVVAPIAPAVQPATATGTVRAATARAPPTSC